VKLRLGKGGSTNRPVIEGFLDIVKGNKVIGWARDPHTAFKRIEVEILVDGRHAGTVKADQHRIDLAKKGIGDGRHAFGFELPEEFQDGKEHLVSARVPKNGGDLRNSPQRVVLERRNMFEGNVDLLQGMEVIGWAWNANQPDEAVYLDLLIDGQLGSRILADKYREDLKKKNFGTCRHGFSIILPDRLKDNRVHTVRFRVSSSDFELKGSPLVRPFSPTNLLIRNSNFSEWSNNLVIRAPGDGPDGWLLKMDDNAPAVVSRMPHGDGKERGKDDINVLPSLCGPYFLRLHQLEQPTGADVTRLEQSVNFDAGFGGKRFALRIVSRSLQEIPVEVRLGLNHAATVEKKAFFEIKKKFNTTRNWQEHEWFFEMPAHQEIMLSPGGINLFVSLWFPPNTIYAVDIGAVDLSPADPPGYSGMGRSIQVPEEKRPDTRQREVYEACVVEGLESNRFQSSNHVRNGCFFRWLRPSGHEAQSGKDIPEHWSIFIPPAGLADVSVERMEYIDDSYRIDVTSRPFVRLRISDNNSYIRFQQEYGSAWLFDCEEVVFQFYARGEGGAVIRNTFFLQYHGDGFEVATKMGEYDRLGPKWKKFVSRVKIPRTEQHKIKSDNKGTLCFQIVGSGIVDISSVWLGNANLHPDSEIIHDSFDRFSRAKEMQYHEYIATVEARALQPKHSARVHVILLVSDGNYMDKDAVLAVKTIRSALENKCSVSVGIKAGSVRAFRQVKMRISAGIQGTSLGLKGLSFHHVAEDKIFIHRQCVWNKDAYVALLEPGDLLRNDFTAFFQASLSDLKKTGKKHVSAVVFDHDYLSSQGVRHRPVFKPGFSPDLLIEHDYVGRGVVFHARDMLAIRESGCPLVHVRRDMLLKLFDAGRSILKIDQILLHCVADRAENKSKLREQDEQFARLTLKRRGLSETGKCMRLPGQVAVSYRPLPGSRVSIIIPFRDRVDLLRQCIESIFSRTSFAGYELILVNNQSHEPETKEYLSKLEQENQGKGKITILDYPGAFNYSAINNFAARHARGDFLVFLNNDVEVITPDWLDELTGFAALPGVGAVGAKLLFPDGSIQHGGVAVGLRDLAGHVFANRHDVEIPDFGFHTRNCSAVTGACLAIRKDLFFRAGGLCEDFIVTGNDVDLGLRLMAKGYRSVYNPRVRLFHYEKQTRSDKKIVATDIAMSLKRYEPYLSNGDPYWNHCLSPDDTGWNVRHFGEESGPARRSKAYGQVREARLGNRRNRQAEFLARYDAGLGVLDENRRLMERFHAGDRPRIRSIAWFFPPFTHVYRGGAYTMLRLAMALQKEYGTRNIFVPCSIGREDIGPLVQQCKEAFPGLDPEWHQYTLEDAVEAIPPADIGICTLWTTAYTLVRYNQCKGKFYLVQDFEPVFEAAGGVYGLIEETYRFGFSGICNSKGVARTYKHYGCKDVLDFTPAVDRKIFHPMKRKQNRDQVRIVFYGRPANPRNAFDLGIQALSEIKSIYRDSVEIISVGSHIEEEQGDQGRSPTWACCRRSRAWPNYTGLVISGLFSCFHVTRLTSPWNTWPRVALLLPM